MKSKFKVGIIGAGGIARSVHMAGWKDIPDAEVVAVADVDEARAQAFAAEFGIPHAFSSFKKLLQLGLDAVDICTPNRVHTPAVVAALESGKHVLCEKPLAVSTAEVRKMGAAAARKKRLLMTAQHQRFSDMAVSLKHFVDAGNLGQVYHARVHALRRNFLPTSPGFIDSSLSGGGPCMDIGVHALDLAMWLMGFPEPVRVTGTARINFAKGNTIPGGWGEWDRKRFDVEDFASGFVHFDNGATMVLEASWLQHQRENEDMSCRLYGAAGSVAWPSGEYATATNRALHDGVLKAAPGQKKPHTAEIHAFHNAIVNGKPSPVPWTESIKVIAILEGIYKSQKTGREVVLKRA